ncbi:MULTISPECIES: sensor histidine kinase [unclassified Oceanispirochaeta]|uniref:sensor histidine kinase n=1 Tax=unclassified Oceanispirochaeta TaxID=2635722 RepID=UPI000E08FBB3|nr:MULTISPECIES: histidine kinase [unclassified Oceanispirochaeta]MBF9016562.1 histidine kinase [Oceanispirochaeta sp. M2]NPD73025.1 histidine kinase [Oceanispirochaeta sp. M1]RDG31373.1 HAMP domain-containing protein [Oceanispirochaeta sp. M1]
MGFTLEKLSSDYFQSISQEQRDSLITDKLFLINRMYPYISEIIMVDYSQTKSYSMTLLNGRDIKLDYDFFSSMLLKDLQSMENRKIILPPHFPEYIFSRTEKVSYPVITIGLNIFDNRYYTPEKPTGSMLINFNPEIFLSKAIDIDQDFPGRFLIMDKKTNVILFDTETILQGETFNEDFFTQPLYQLRKINLSWNDLILVQISDDNKIQDLYKKNRILILLIMTLISSVLLLTVFYLSHLMRRRLKPLLHSMENIKHGDFNSQIKISHIDEFSLIEEAFNKMCTTLDDYINRVYKAELLTQTSQLKLLKQQFNPHFMYNTLQSIQMKALINKDQETSEMVQILGDIFRWSLKEKAEVSLGEELHFLSRYIDLQSFRFKYKLSLDIDIPIQLQSTPVLKMIFQPLLENAIYHGLGNLEKKGKFRLSVSDQKNILMFKIEDNGDGIDKEKLDLILHSLQEKKEADESHIGLMNLHNRVTKYYGNSEIGITSIISSHKGTTIFLSIPKRDARKDIKQ